MCDDLFLRDETSSFQEMISFLSSMYSINFLLIIARATGTGMLMNTDLTSNDNQVSSDATLCSLSDSAKPLLSLKIRSFPAILLKAIGYKFG